MSRNLYTIAVVSEACEEALRSVVVPPAEGAVIHAEEYLREAVAAHDPLVAFYEVVLDGWNRTHEEMRVHTDPGLQAVWDALSQTGCAFVPAETLAFITPRAYPPVHAALTGREAADSLWGSLCQAVRVSLATGCRMVVLTRTLCASFDDAEYRPKGRVRANELMAIGPVAGSVDLSLVPNVDKPQHGCSWALWLLFQPSFHSEVAIGFEEDATGGTIVIRSARFHLAEWWGGPRPEVHVEWLRKRLLPPRVWESSCRLEPEQWRSVVCHFRGTEWLWSVPKSGCLDGCSIRAWYQVDGAVRAMPVLNTLSARYGLRALLNAAVLLARRVAEPEMDSVLADVARYVE